MKVSTYAAQFTQALNDKFADDKYCAYTVEAGRKYDKIVNFDGNQHSVHAFVDRVTGDLIKPATWRAPQRDKDGLAVRFNLSTDEGFAEAIDAAGWAGGYLYK